jgi:hypothetical protein
VLDLICGLPLSLPAFSTAFKHIPQVSNSALTLEYVHFLSPNGKNAGHYPCSYCYKCIGSTQLCNMDKVVLYSIIFYSVLFCSILFHSILFFSNLFYSILFYYILFYTVLVILIDTLCSGRSRRCQKGS